MIFPKGSRFVPPKIPDVPGPNTYNTVQESQLDAYKRGAFLEKTDRFLKDKVSEVPGPGAYNSDTNTNMLATRPSAKRSTTPSGTPPNLADRYATLQRKLDDLEKIHVDGKKSHQIDMERLKSELSRSQKTNTEQAERIDKLKKQNDALDVRIQELKKTASTDQAEIKDLRVKLRISEHERTQLSAKTGEAGEAKKALQALDSKRRDDMRDRDRKIAELEKAVATEKKKREGAEVRLSEANGKVDGEAQEAREAARSLKTQLDAARHETQCMLSSHEALKSETASKEEGLVLQLEQYRALLGRVAEEYGRLASQATPKSEHLRVKHEHAELLLRVARLERKLANSEGQVVEVANLVRHTKEQNLLLASQLRDAEDEAAFYSRALSGIVQDAQAHSGYVDWPWDKLVAVQKSIHDSERQALDMRLLNGNTLCDFYRLKCDELFFCSSVLDQTLEGEKEQVRCRSVELSNTVAARDTALSQFEAVRTECEAVQQQLVAASASIGESKIAADAARKELGNTKAQMHEEISKNEQALKKERETVQRLSMAVQQNKISEEALHAEIEQLTTELTDAARFQEAYYSLTDEVGALVARNALAEDEAEMLSKFNAEILGHNNPAQRIMYVDRIRRELAETKQKLLVSTRAHDVTTADNDDLRNELAMYKSVIVPMEHKPRTNITRVDRPPLANQSINVNPSFGKNSSGHGEKGKVGLSWSPELETVPGDMTLDEIM